MSGVGGRAHAFGHRHDGEDPLAVDDLETRLVDGNCDLGIPRLASLAVADRRALFLVRVVLHHGRVAHARANKGLSSLACFSSWYWHWHLLAASHRCRLRASDRTATAVHCGSCRIPG